MKPAAGSLQATALPANSVTQLSMFLNAPKQHMMRVALLQACFTDERINRRGLKKMPMVKLHNNISTVPDKGGKGWFQRKQKKQTLLVTLKQAVLLELLSSRLLAPCRQQQCQRTV
jgi:hypothetical protein